MLKFDFLVFALLGAILVGAEEIRNVLLIGNSYTSANNLDKMLQAMLLEDGAVNVYRYTIGSKKLIQHLADAKGDEETQLRKWLVTDPEPWTWVVLQEQSQIPGLFDYSYEFEESLFAASQLDRIIASTGAGTIFYTTWGRRNGDDVFFGIYPNFLGMNIRIVEGYHRYFAATNTAERPTKVAPVGQAFEYIYQYLIDQGLDPLASASDFANLYQTDGSHPSQQGTYLAACVLYATLTGNDPRSLVYVPSGLDEDVSFRLRSVASQQPENDFSCLPSSSEGSSQPSSVVTSPGTTAREFLPSESPSFMPSVASLTSNARALLDPLNTHWIWLLCFCDLLLRDSTGFGCYAFVILLLRDSTGHEKGQ
jgi:hypothetical protein